MGIALSFIFTHEELRRLFKAAGTGRRRCHKLDADTFRTFLLLLYAAALRSGEARRLTLADVDLDAAVLAVNDSKFYKSRLVPVGPDLVGELCRYVAIRTQRPLREGTASTFLACRDGSPLKKGTVQNAFHATLRVAGIGRSKPGCRPPCLHSLRHYLDNFLISGSGITMSYLFVVLTLFFGLLPTTRYNPARSYRLLRKPRRLSGGGRSRPIQYIH